LRPGQIGRRDGKGMKNNPKKPGRNPTTNALISNIITIKIVACSAPAVTISAPWKIFFALTKKASNFRIN
jgi:hypothetical protein